MTQNYLCSLKECFIETPHQKSASHFLRLAQNKQIDNHKLTTKLNKKDIK